MMGGLSKDDAQRNRDLSQDDTRMIKPKILKKRSLQKKKTKKVVIILIYRMTELNHRMIRGPIILIILIKLRPAFNKAL